MHPLTPPLILRRSSPRSIPRRDTAHSHLTGLPPSTPRATRLFLHRSPYRSSFLVPTSLPAFTLTELLIVIGIIVLFVTLALPAFNLISGSKSIAGAENELSALLARARNEAMGVQDYRGLAIYRDAATDRYCAAIVENTTVAASAYPSATPTPAYAKYSYVTTVISGITHTWVALVDIPANTTTGVSPPPNSPPSSTSSTSTIWSLCDSYPGSLTLDITSDSDVQPLPAGVGVQVINNCTMNGSTGLRSSNGYLPIGVILFDKEGVLTAVKSVSFAVYGHLGAIGNFQTYNLITSPTPQGTIPFYLATTSTTGQGLPLNSSFGLVVFDKQSFETNNFYASLNPQFPSQLESYSSNLVNGIYQPQTTSSSGTGDGQADYWLDQNATPLLINRYNGTLIRSE
jgi:type II secretory pathway pseudopilin PulG